jgi:hypothetical protein
MKVMTAGGATNNRLIPTELVAEVATTSDAANEGSSMPSPFNFDAFHTNLYGHTRNEEAARKSRTRAVDTIVSAIMSVRTCIRP